MKLAFMAALLATAAFGETWTGTVVDEHCGAKHTNAAAADVDCVKKCLAGGAAPLLVVDGKLYKIANRGAVKGHEGQKVTVTGTLKGDTIRIDAVSK